MLEKMPAAVGHALKGMRAGLDKLTYERPDLAAPETLSVSSPAFAAGGAIPATFTADGSKTSPPLGFGEIPATARSLALVVEDADSPTPAPLCHLLAWNIPTGTSTVPEGALASEAVERPAAGLSFGKNSFLHAGWLPPDPPTGHGAHRYCFQLYALDCDLDLADNAGRGELTERLAGHVVAKGMLIGTYERPG